MNNFAFIFFVISFQISWSQSLVDKICLDDHWMHFEVFDSTIEIISNETFEGHDFKFYSQHLKAKLTNGNSVSISLYQDSTILYQEYDTSGVYTTFGELKPNRNLLHLQKTKMLLDYGEVDYNDTLFHFSKVGTWTKIISNEISQIASYQLGRKIDEQVRIHPFCEEGNMVLVPMEKYKIDSTNWTIEFVLPNHTNLQKLISGHWYSPDCRFYYRLVNNPYWVFQRGEPKHQAYDGPLDCDFNKNGEFEAHFRFTCGRGVSKDDTNPHREWKLDKNNNLIIGKGLYKIIYIDEQNLYYQEIVENQK